LFFRRKTKSSPEGTLFMTQPKLSRPCLPINYASFKVGSGLAATSSAHQNSAASSIPTPAEPRRVTASKFRFRIGLRPTSAPTVIFDRYSPPKPHIDSLDAATDR
jgi:hypothetical protein